LEGVLEKGENIYDIESELCHQSGKKVFVRLNAAVLKNEDQQPIGGVISFRDMSYLEKIQKDLIGSTNFYGVIGQHKSMIDIYNLIEEVAESDSSVLIIGESGTGKEMIANAIQEVSRRKSEPYIKINCSVFPPTILASELFGHVKGAFTDAVKDRIGRFELADKGTIFLDEIAEMPLQMQVQLLRVLQEGTFERVGESVTRKVDVRVIAATNKDIYKEMEEGHFREDLFYRLNVIPINIPPLRKHRSDIPHLVQHFINKYSLISSKEITEIDDEAMDLLVSYNWPGNIRELENSIEYAFARTKDKMIHASKLPPNIRMHMDYSDQYTQEKPTSAKIDEYRKLRQVLEKHHWNRSKAATELGMGRTTLWRKMKAHDLDK
jgi:transcriptional regulator with PAS, ATPase and Fis domain